MKIIDYDDNLGNVKIAPQVIEVITKISSLEVDGVANISGGFAKELKEFLGRSKNLTSGIKVEVDDSDVTIDVSLILKYGYNLTEVAEKVQENIKNTVQNMTDLRVSAVNVHIDGVHFEDNK